MKRNSIYALNKLEPDAIIYRDADGMIIRLTKEDFDSEEEFLRWKKWSDEDYHAEERKQHVEENHTVSLTSAMEASMECQTQEAMPDEKDVDEKSLLLMCRDQFTDKQFRRYWLYRIEKLTEKEIADKEGVRQQNVSKSIQSAEKIFVNFLKTKMQHRH